MANRFQSDRKGPSQRQLRAGELIRHVLAEILQRGEAHDSDLPDTPITITEVKTSPDLRNATVYCTALGQEGTGAAIDGLNKASAKIRAVLAKKIEMKFTPALTFRADESFDEAARIDALLRGSSGRAPE